MADDVLDHTANADPAATQLWGAAAANASDEEGPAMSNRHLILTNGDSLFVFY